jgi:hypothetical protein
MFNNVLLLVIVSSILFLPTVSADSEVKRSLRYGLMVGSTSLDVDDPDGKTAATTVTSFPNILLVSDLTRDKRLFVNMFGQFAKLDASDQEIGQEITRNGVTGALQFAFLEKAVWAGVGVGLVQEKYELRHRIDENGNLIPGSDLEDRDEFAVPFLVNLSTQYSINRDLDVGFHFQYEAPIKGEIKSVSLYGYFLY